MADLLPPNATPLERALSLVDDRMLGVPTDLVRAVKSPADCPTSLLPYLALERAVPVWESSWSEQIQRQVIAAAYGVKARAGTRQALEDSLGALGLAIAVSEWFEYAGSPYRFRLAVSIPDGVGWSSRQHRILTQTTRAAKNARSRLERVDVRMSGGAVPLYVGAAVYGQLRIRPTADPITRVSGQATSFIGQAFRSRVRIRPAA